MSDVAGGVGLGHSSTPLLQHFGFLFFAMAQQTDDAKLVQELRAIPGLN